MIIKIIVLSALLSVMVGCDRHTAARDRMDLAESLMAARPDSALLILSDIESVNPVGEKETARYALLKSMALDKNYIDTTSFHIIQPAIDYFLENGTPDEKLKTCYYQGRIYQNRGDNDSAMQSFMRGREFCGEASDTLTAANLLVAQATIMYSTYKTDDFILNNLEAAKLYKAIGRTDYEVLSLANALDGSFIKRDRQLADSIMPIARAQAAENPDLDSVLTPYILSYVVNFGTKEDIVGFLNYYNSMAAVDDYEKMDIADAYLRIGDPHNAKRFLDSIAPASTARKSLKYLAIKPDVLEQNGDFAGALAAYRDYSCTIDSIHRNIFSNDLLFAQKRHNMERANLLELRQKDKLIGLSICVAFVLLIVAGYVYYHYRLEKAKRQLDDQEKNKLQLEQENLRLKISQLEDESISLKELLSKQNNLDKPIEDAIKIRIEMLNALLATHITENDLYAKPYEEWRDRLIHDKHEFMTGTRLAFKATHPKFIEYLEQHGLTEAELNYVCLYAIGLRGKEVGEYIQLKRHYNISSEIRRKLGIDEHQTNIGIYVRRLMKQL